MLAAAAVYLLLPPAGGRSILGRSICGIAALIVAGIVCIQVEGSVSPESFLFYSFSRSP